MQFYNILSQFTLVQNLKKENNSAVNSILSDIQFKLNSISDETNKNIESQLDNLEISTFRNSLIKEHSPLTCNEIELCMMIVSGMDGRKIGNTKSITPNSVRTNKSRLKKKFNLDKDEDLKHYLISLIDKQLNIHKLYMLCTHSYLA